MRAHASLRLGSLRGTTPELLVSPWYCAWDFCVVWEAGRPHKTSSPPTQRRNGRAFSSLTARGGGLPVGVTPSLIFGAHVEHGVLFWDVVVTGCFKKIPPYQSFFLFRYGEDGSDLYAVFPQLSVDVVSQECYGLVPVGNARLLPTELESHGC